MFGHNHFISDLIFNFLRRLLQLLGCKRLTWSYIIIYLVVFQKSEILKNVVFERWCTDSESLV